MNHVTLHTSSCAVGSGGVGLITSNCTGKSPIMLRHWTFSFSSTDARCCYVEDVAQFREDLAGCSTWQLAIVSNQKNKTGYTRHEQKRKKRVRWQDELYIYIINVYVIVCICMYIHMYIYIYICCIYIYK